MKIKTKLTKLGRDPKKQKGFINPGIYKGSTMIFNNFKDYLEDLRNADDRTTWYGVNKNPFHKQLEQSISKLYNSEDTVIASSGLAAVIIPFLTFLKNNDEVLINDSVYGPTRTFCTNVLKNYGIKIKYFHSTKNISDFEKLVTKKTKLIYLECPGTSTFDILDIPFITKIAKRKKIPTALDNTWASPIFCDPIKLGINIIIDAGTKYINGHSDVLIGFVSSDKKYAKKIRITTKTLGIIPGSEEVYLTLRGIPTLHSRIKEIEKNANNMAKFLLTHHLVQDVYHPALPHTINHNIWKRDFKGSTGLFAFALKKKYSNKVIHKFYKKLKIFKLGYSWGGFDSLITFPQLEERSIKEKKFNGNLVRLYCGLEDSEDQIKDISDALKILK
ncbi:MAG: Cystathionine beta-lyase MetC [Alphaproteobacteria bacterium MarineAlpha5_Bin6]|nr:MAG: Cystathionine beta-lyase MetC [Alphaproteobacteria bacterium MarineAlpha5_Bin6]|tara:strand:+ start:411 stop:1574 length:1164 start_codon:yes stop_codon:yes gene_type:complete